MSVCLSVRPDELSTLHMSDRAEILHKCSCYAKMVFETWVERASHRFSKYLIFFDFQGKNFFWKKICQIELKFCTYITKSLKRWYIEFQTRAVIGSLDIWFFQFYRKKFFWKKIWAMLATSYCDYRDEL